jgi:signal transduction histidine kinase
VDPRSLELSADPEQIEQVLINLIRNALEALDGQAGGRIELSADMDGRGRMLIRVSDNGPGIVPEALEKVFIPFFTTKPAGSGIGLSLCRQIMRLHRGSITARSEPGVDTVFALRF